jgi:hypothetical protein
MNREPSLPARSAFADIPDPFGDAGPSVAPQRPPPRPRAPSPTRARTRGVRVLAIASALLYEVAVAARLHMHAAGRPPGRLAIGLAAPLAAGAVVLAVGARRGSLGLGPPAARVALATAFGPALFVAASLLMLPAMDEGGQYWPHALACMVTGTALAAGPVALVALAWRRAFASAAAWRTAALGVASGALATTTLSLVCPDVSSWHVVVGHGAAMVLGGLVGAVVARRTARA